MKLKIVIITLLILPVSQKCKAGSITFRNQGLENLLLVTGTIPTKPLKRLWVGGKTITEINIPFRKLKYLTIFRQPRPIDSPKTLTAIKVLKNLEVSPFGKIDILYFDPKHTTVIKH